MKSKLFIPNVLSIAGSDPSGGAGIQADLKTFGALGCYGMAALTSLTAQNTHGVFAIHNVPADFVAAQIDSIFADISVAAVKLGLLATPEIVTHVAERLRLHQAKSIVLDPVLVATSGDRLGSEGLVEAMARDLAPMVSVVTPNLPEAAALSGLPQASSASELRATAARILDLGFRYVLIKGGHADSPNAIDYLFSRQSEQAFAAPRVPTRNTHGTGCTLSSAIAASLAYGLALPDAIAQAKAYLTGALKQADELEVGHKEGNGHSQGHGPVHHFWLHPRG